MMRRLRGIWRDLSKQGKVELGNDGEFHLVIRPKDPSLTEQLRQRRDLHPADLMESYLDAVRKAPGASDSTKRKWRKALGL